MAGTETGPQVALEPGRGLTPSATMTTIRRLHLAEAAWAQQRLGLREIELAAVQLLLDAKRRGRPVRQRDVGAALGITDSSSSVLVDRLVRQGLVRRIVPSGIVRSVRVETTEHGDEAIGAHLDEFYARISTVLETMPPAERDVVHTFLDGVGHAIAADTAPGGSSRSPSGR